MENLENLEEEIKPLEDLGKLEGAVRPSKVGQIVTLVLGLLGMASYIFVRQLWEGFSWIGLPSENVVFVLSLALIVLSVVQLVRGISEKATIELYERGIKVEDFVAPYNTLTIKERTGAINKKLDLTSEGKTYTYDHAISSNDYKLIRIKISQSSRKVS